MGSIENRANILARLAGREAKDPDEETAAAETESELATLREMVESVEATESAPSKEIAAALRILAKCEIDLLVLLGKASVAGAKSQGFREEINALLQKAEVKSTGLKEHYATSRKSELAEEAAEQHDVVRRAAAPEAPRRWRKGGVVKAGDHLVIEVPETRNMPAVGALYDMLAELEARPGRIDDIMTFVDKRLREMTPDPRFKAEAKQFVRVLGTLRERVLGHGGNVPMSDKEIADHAAAALDHFDSVKKHAAEALKRLGDDRPIEALPKDNIFRGLGELNRMPYFLGALSAVAKQMNTVNSSSKLKPVKQFRGNALTRPVSAATYYGGLGAFGALALGSAAFAASGSSNFINNFVENIPQIRDYLTTRGYARSEVDVIVQEFARWTGLGAAALGTKWMLNYRPHSQRDTPVKSTKFWIGAFVCVGGALAGLMEKSANTYDVTDMAGKAKAGIGPIKAGATALPERLNAVAKQFSDGTRNFVATEADNGGTGSATMAYIFTYLATPSAEQDLAFQEFLRTKDKDGKHAARIPTIRSAIEEVNQMEKYKRFNLRIGKRGVRHAIEDLFKQIDPKMALETLGTFDARAEEAGSTTMLGHMIGDLDVFKLFGHHDDTRSLTVLKNRVTEEFRKLLFEKYEKGLAGDLALLLEYIDDVSAKVGINLRESAKRDKGRIVGTVTRIDSFMNLPSLGITEKHFTDLDKAIGNGAVTSAYSLLMTDAGRVKLGRAIRSGTPWKTFDENYLPHVATIFGTLGLAYGVFDVGPGGIIELMNRAANRRFRTELGQKHNEAYAVESNISMTIANHISSTLAAGSLFLELKDLGDSFAVPPEIIAIHVRRKLAEKALKEIPELSGKRQMSAKVRHFTTPVGLIESQLGFDNPYFEPDAQGQIAKVAWLREIDKRIMNNDSDLIAELASEIAPQYKALVTAVTGMQSERKASVFSLERYNVWKKQGTDEAYALRRRQLELVVSEIPAQIAMLRATQKRIRETTADSDDKPLVLGTSGRIRVTPEYIKHTFLLNQIGNDIWRYEVALKQARDMGISVEKKMGDVQSAVFAAIEEKAGGWQTPKPESAVEQAMLDQLIEANTRRFAGLEQESEALDMRAFEQYMNELNDGIGSILHDFNAQMPYLLRNRKDLVLVYDRDERSGRNLLSIKLLDAPRLEDGSEGTPEVIASVPFLDRPIPDFSSDRASAQDALESLALWLAPGGDAMVLMRAQVQRREITKLLGDHERKLLRESSDMRFKLGDSMDYIGSDGKSANYLDDVAVLKSLRTWKQEADSHFTELDATGETVDRTNIDDSSVTAITALYTDARSASTAAQKDMQLIRTAAAFALKNLPRGAELLYDAKPDTPQFVLVKGGKETPFDITTPAAEVLKIYKKT